MEELRRWFLVDLGDDAIDCTILMMDDNPLSTMKSTSRSIHRNLDSCGTASRSTIAAFFLRHSPPVLAVITDMNGVVTIWNQ